MMPIQHESPNESHEQSMIFLSKDNPGGTGKENRNRRAFKCINLVLDGREKVTCNANVFTKLEENIYKCNACDAMYEGS